MNSRLLTPAILQEFAADFLARQKSGDSKDLLVLDFDGVLAHRNENDFYSMEVRDGEREFLSEVSSHLHVPNYGYDTRYLRHLVYQAAALAIKVEIAPTSLVEFARTVQTEGMPWFIVSARSGNAAVRRMYEFLDRYSLNPTEVFNIGRVSKRNQISHLAELFPDDRLVFIEDSVVHVADLESEKYTNVDIVLFVEDQFIDSSKLFRSCYDVIMKASNNAHKTDEEFYRRRQNIA